MGLGLSKVPQRRVADDEGMPEDAFVPVTEETAEAAAPAVDEFDGLVVEQPAPDVTAPPPAPAAGPGPEASKDAAGKKKDEEEEEDKDEEAEASAEASQEEAAEFATREEALKAARDLGMSQEEAQRAVADDMQRQALAQVQMGQMQAGAVASIVGALAMAVKGTGRMIANGARAAVGRGSSDQGVLRDRTFGQWYDGYENGLATLDRAAADLKKDVSEFNAAFLNTEAASRLREMAKGAGQDFDSYMADLRSGRLEDASAKTAAAEAMSDPAVASAWEKVSASMATAENASKGMVSNFSKVMRNFSDRVDGNLHAERINEVMEKMSEVKPALYEGQGKVDAAQGQKDSEQSEKDRKDLMERIREMTENIMRVLRDFFARFSGGPAAPK